MVRLAAALGTDGGAVLTRSALEQMFRGAYPTREQLVDVLCVLRLPPAETQDWVKAWERVGTPELPAAHEGELVGNADPYWLGVHRASPVPGVASGVLPTYIERDSDTGRDGLRALIRAAGEKSGFVLLTGGPSSGKTRSAYEAVRRELHRWRLVAPADAAEIRGLAASGARRMVVWLDDLQPLLDGPDALDTGPLWELRRRHRELVIVATLRADVYRVYDAEPPRGAPDPWARQRRLLRLADRLHVKDVFCAAEQNRAQAAARRDPLIRAAAAAGPSYGLTQALTAGPQLVERWEAAAATDPYLWAVLTAAADAARLGVRAPVTRGYLKQVASSYCTGPQIANAPDRWFETALQDAQEPWRGVARTLEPQGTPDLMGHAVGYTVAPYLLQHVARTRRAELLPAEVWPALVKWVQDPADALRVADQARARLLICIAEPLYRHAADAGSPGTHAAGRLAQLLADRDEYDELQRRLDEGDREAGYQLAHMYLDRACVDEAIAILIRFADSDRRARVRLNEVLREYGHLEALRARADAGDRDAAKQDAQALRDRGDERTLWVQAAHSDPAYDDSLARLLYATGNRHGLRRRARRGCGHAARLLLKLECYDTKLFAKLAALPTASNPHAREWLVAMMAERGDLEGLLQRAPDDPDAARKAVDLLKLRGDVEALRSRATHDPYASTQLARLLYERNDLAGLLRLTHEGDKAASTYLDRLFCDQRNRKALTRRADKGVPSAGAQLAERLHKDHDARTLLARAQRGDRYAAARYADTLDAMRRTSEATRVRSYGLTPDGKIASAEIIRSIAATSGPQQSADQPSIAPAPVRWDQLDADSFERLLARLLELSGRYTQITRHIHVNAPDAGRDVQAYLRIDDGLGSERLDRVIAQAKHRPRHGIRADELADLIHTKLPLWEGDPVRSLIMATSGTFTQDTVRWAENHNRAGNRPHITLWSHHEIEGHLRKWPALIAEFGL